MVTARALSLAAAILTFSVVPTNAEIIAPVGSRTGVDLYGEVANHLLGEFDSDNQEDEDSQGGTIDPLSSSATLSVAVPDNYVDAQGAVSASWSSLTSGHVEFDNVGWTNGNTVPSGLGSGSIEVLALWEYHFVGPDSPVTVTFTYDISEDGAYPFGINGFTIYRFGVWGGSLTTLDAFYYIPPGTSGTWISTFDTLALGSDSYGIGINAVGNVAGGLFEFEQGSMNGIFDWSLTEGFAVPEPSSFALLGTGFISLMAYRRRRPNRRD